MDRVASPLLRQYAVVVVVNLCIIMTGLNLMWASPVLVKLRDVNQTVLPTPITEEEGSWIVSIGFLFSIFGTFLPALLLDRLGRKLCILLTSAPRIVVWLLLTFANQLWMLLVGKIVNGFCDMLSFTIIPIYASEIASTKVRGALGTILQIMLTLGMVIALSIGSYAPYFTLNGIILGFAITTFIPLLFIPESPFFLYRQGKTEKAVEVLTFLRGSKVLACEEILEYSHCETDVKVSKIGLLKKRTFLKALGIVLVLTLGIQLVGYNAVSIYLQTILESTHTSVPPELASMIIGIIQLVASIISSQVTDRYGRKIVMCIPLIGMMSGMAGLGTFFTIQESTDKITGALNFLPLISLMLVVFCFHAGLGSVYWGLSAELFDSTSRPFGLTIASCLSMTLAFLSTRYFAPMVSVVGPAPAYWMFSANCVLVCLFVIFCIPETKGQTFAEIQVLLGGSPCQEKTDEEELKGK